jgi:hypothetical protein
VFGTVFGSTWSWVVPLVGAAGVFGGVLAMTPPGFQAIWDVVFGSPRGVLADAAAYALGAAASLALGALLVLAAAAGAFSIMLRRFR